ncbi:MAG: sulfatase family protein [Planctomycetota bacterium]|jgi:arylsulfatase A-like enzyme
MRNLKRRQFLKLFGTGAVSFTAMGSTLQALEQKKLENVSRKPNIIFVHTDSWDGRALGFLGLEAMKRATPNIDRLAKRGTTFKNTYCSHPICCPSRANTLSGTYTFKCKSWNNYKGLEPGARTLFGQFEDAGYDNGVFGKTDYLSGGHTQLARISAWTGTADIKLPLFRVEAPKITDNRTNSDIDWKTTESGLKFLEKTADSSKPFFLYVGLTLPHPPFTTSQKWLDMIDIDKVTVPPKDKQDHPVMEYQQITNNWRHGFDDKMVKKVRAIYYALCSETDAMVGRLMDRMDQLGLADNTYFVFSSDHGENNMEHRQWYKMNMYESSVRVPLIVAGPNIKQGQIIDNIVSLIDLYPTFTEMADLKTPEGLDGESLMPLITGKTRDSRNVAFAMFTGCTSNTSMFMLRKGNWKYIAYPGFEPQLFNLKEDPDEIDNIAALFPDVVKKMDKELMAICDYKKVHAERVAYDKKSFSEYRALRKKEPMHLIEYGANIPKAYYMDIMTNTYIGYTSEHEEKIKKWLVNKL